MFQLSEHSPLATVGGTQEYITQASAQTHTVWNVFLTGVNLMSVQPLYTPAYFTYAPRFPSFCLCRFTES